MVTAGMGPDACHVKSTMPGVVVYFAGEDSGRQTTTGTTFLSWEIFTHIVH